ncbi:MAG TPA: Ada metal-binding domain-containing protein [Solirubrobacteraceae bacterium]|nr:Ada metal-binding domain-containing protein [Solirubrobacteraceae bacterium]
MLIDEELLWRAIASEDPRFDGWVFCGVLTTGIYCRPSCPARTPKRENVRLFATAAAAQTAGFRACKRCRPDASPGSPEWDRRADIVGRAMRLIADGVVDREGVSGLATRLGYSERHVHRRLVEVVGAGPLSLARAQRAQAARTLLETTAEPVTHVAFAAGFQSLRQFNATIREVFAMTPSALRARARSAGRPEDSGTVVLRLPYRSPLNANALLSFLARRAVAGVEEGLVGGFRRSLRLPRGPGVVELTPLAGHVHARFRLDDLRDLAAAMQRARRMLDLDSDPIAVDEALGADALLGALVRMAPGRRIPGAPDGDELALRAVLGQQVSLSGAATLAGRIVRACGERIERPLGAVTHLFPSAAALAQVDPQRLGMPASRARALLALAQALADGRLVLDAGAEHRQARAALLALPGIGPWTVDYVAMRGLRDPDAFPAGDLGVRRALELLGEDPRGAARVADRWRPYRAYATVHLWGELSERAAAASQAHTRLQVSAPAADEASLGAARSRARGRPSRARAGAA